MRVSRESSRWDRTSHDHYVNSCRELASFLSFFRVYLGLPRALVVVHGLVRCLDHQMSNLVCVPCIMYFVLCVMYLWVDEINSE